MTADPGSGRPFVGRVETVEALHRRFEDARAGHGGVTLLVGETGVGKSELIADLLRTVRQREVQVLEGRAPLLDAPPPFSLIRSAIESARVQGGSDTADSPGFAPEGFLIGFAPRLSEAASLSPVHIEERLLDALGSADDRGEAGRLPLLNGIAAQFLEFTRRGVTVVVLEDLHRADEPSLAAVEFLARQFRDRPLWIVATSRTPSTLPEARRARIEAFIAAAHAQRVQLRPFTSSEMAEFLHQRDPGRSLSPEEIARWHTETGGYPLLLEQLDRRLETGGALTPFARSTPDGTLVLPALDRDEERAVGVGAVLGPEFSFPLLLRASGDDEERLAETVDRLVGHGILFERPGERLTFSDERLRARVYDGLTESRRRLLHRRAGEALEATENADLPTIYALARHYYLGKVDDKAVLYNRTAADAALGADAPEVAIEHLARALECQRRLAPDDWGAETELVVELAQQVERVGRLEEAEKMLRSHLGRKGLRERLGPAVIALTELYLARLLTDKGEWSEAEKTIVGILDSAGPGTLEGHPAVLMALHRLRGEAFYYAGKYPEALREHSQELGLAGEEGNERARALAEGRRANVLAMMGETESAVRDARHAATTLERLGDLSEAAHARLFLGVIIAGLPNEPSQYEEALKELAAAVLLGERAHNPRHVAWALFNEADLLRGLGRHEEATERNVRSREILERIGDRFGLVNSMIIAGKILTDRGEYERAEVELLDAYRLVRELKASADEVDVVLRLAQLSYARGDRASARRRVAELDRHQLPKLRPDLALEFEHLRSALLAKEAAGGHSK
ncbi:MAG: AAA family ATPase [Thermoplasmata archaeon]